jgi:predicted DCC family thiol-disulfide oxidoreductase YuxK
MVKESIILYDGHCMLCSRFVQYVLRHDDRKYFRFCPIQSNKASDLLNKAGYTDPVDLTTMLLVTPKGVLTESTAALRILCRLKGLSPLLGMGWLLPSIARDAIYRLVARNRIRVFGARTECFLPDATWSDRLITDLTKNNG